MVGRVFWGADGCNAGSMDNDKAIYLERAGGDQPRRTANDQDNHSPCCFDSFSD